MHDPDFLNCNKHLKDGYSCLTLRTLNRKGFLVAWVRGHNSAASWLGAQRTLSDPVLLLNCFNKTRWHETLAYQWISHVQMSNKLHLSGVNYSITPPVEIGHYNKQTCAKIHKELLVKLFNLTWVTTSRSCRSSIEATGDNPSFSQRPSFVPSDNSAKPATNEIKTAIVNISWQLAHQGI